jgi:hypothetical protein
MKPSARGNAHRQSTGACATRQYRCNSTTVCPGMADGAEERHVDVVSRFVAIGDGGDDGNLQMLVHERRDVEGPHHSSPITSRRATCLPTRPCC